MESSVSCLDIFTYNMYHCEIIIYCGSIFLYESVLFTFPSSELSDSLGFLLAQTILVLVSESFPGEINQAKKAMRHKIVVS